MHEDTSRIDVLYPFAVLCVYGLALILAMESRYWKNPRQWLRTLFRRRLRREADRKAQV